MGMIKRRGQYGTIKILIDGYRNAKEYVESVDMEKNVHKSLGAYKGLAICTEDLIEHILELIESDEEVNEAIKNGEVSEYV